MGARIATMPTDLSLGRRLDRTEGRAGVSFVEARARLMPESKANWTEIAGALAMFDGPESPVTQTFGLGLFGNVEEAEFARVEEFFFDQGAPANHDVCPLAGAAFYGVLVDRGYKPVEVANVMYLALAEGIAALERQPTSSAIEVDGPETIDRDTWAQTAAAGWQHDVEIPGLLDLMRVGASRPDGLPFLAKIDGKAIAAADLFIADGVALMSGASTVPAARKQGAQRSLVRARLRYAAEKGCEFAMLVAEPGSQSQRNAEANGFRVAYTRTKWSKPVTNR
jgi:GNAT superfamily N-acetyltransferase